MPIRAHKETEWNSLYLSLSLAVSLSISNGYVWESYMRSKRDREREREEERGKTCHDNQKKNKNCIRSLLQLPNTSLCFLSPCTRYRKENAKKEIKREEEREREGREGGREKVGRG